MRVGGQGYFRVLSLVPMDQMKDVAPQVVRYPLLEMPKRCDEILSPLRHVAWWKAVDSGFGFEHGAMPALKEAVK